VPDSHNELSLLPHGVDHFHGNHVGVVSLRELFGSSVQSSSKAITLEYSKFVKEKSENNVQYMVLYFLNSLCPCMVLYMMTSL
jgi:hypothetical protein